MTTLRTTATNEELQAAFENFISSTLTHKLLEEEEIHKMLEEYYAALELKLPEVIKIFDSPLSAWKWIQKNKCIDENEPYVEPSGLSLEYLGYYAHHKFIIDNNFATCDQDLKAKIDLAVRMAQINKVFSFDDCVVVAQNPIETHFNSQRQLHNPNGMSVRFNDGFGFYSLNGIKVPEYIVTTPSGAFTKAQILGEKNADFRREILRKVGSEKMVEILDAKVIDVKGDYSLITVDIGDARTRPFLKMVNPSLGISHIEGVLPSCKTVNDALAWRNSLPSYTPPVALS